MALSPITNVSHLAVNSHIQRYLELLSTAKEVSLDSFTETYSSLQPILHPGLNSPTPDLDALRYSLTRLPDDIFTIRKIYLAQSPEDLKSFDFNLSQWKTVSSSGRKRLTFINPSKDTLVTILSSDSDIHDLINCLICFHLERKKICRLLAGRQLKFIQSEDPRFLNLDQNQWINLKTILGINWKEKLSVTLQTDNISLQLFGKDEPPYQENSQVWLSNLINHSLIVEPKRVPVYFVSSNSHSLVNIIGGFLNQRQTYIFDYISHANPELYQQWFDIKTQGGVERINDFLYYIGSIFLQNHPQFVAEKQNYESSLGIKNISSSDPFQATTQTIPVRSLVLSNNLDRNLKLDPNIIGRSDALIINTEYPLGFAAYYLLHSILSVFLELKSIYIMGKAAILTGSIGDVQLPVSVHDEHTNNDYLINNVFNKNTLFDAHTSTVFPNQKSVSVYGTFLENKSTIDNYVQSGINIVEMESGPYLQSICEKFLLGNNEIAQNYTYNLEKIPIELGIINYASDNPLVKTLAKENIAVEYVEPVYLASLAVLQRIIDLEQQRLS